jgi:hypothetical protein
MKRFSILQDEKKCLVCETTIGIHTHEIFFGTANRKKSIEYGLCAYLCGRHHNMSKQGIHFNRTLDLKIKQMAQKKAMEHYDWTIDDFRKVFGKSWL